jgi:hypothetical protein
MKTLDALILTFNLDRLKQRLNALGLTGMTLSEARSVGPHCQRQASFRESKFG